MRNIERVQLEPTNQCCSCTFTTGQSAMKIASQSWLMRIDAVSLEGFELLMGKYIPIQNSVAIEYQRPTALPRNGNRDRMPKLVSSESDSR